MDLALCITIRFVLPDPLYHGRADDNGPEWPPSPMRLMQALLNAASLQGRGQDPPQPVRAALERLEVLRPRILAPRATVSTVGFRAYVPHNQHDLLMAAHYRGMEESSQAFRRLAADCRIEKDVRPVRIDGGDDELPAVHYIYSVGGSASDAGALLNTIRPVVRAVTHLGWGIDQVAGDASLVDSRRPSRSGDAWSPSVRGVKRLRVHRPGSVEALRSRYQQFLGRLVDGQWTPVAPLTAFDQVWYRPDTEALGRPWCVFRLVDQDDDTYTHPQAKLVHLAGMVRHLAIETMARNPPRGVAEKARWVEQYVAGHRERTEGADGPVHAQLSYVPLPSTGHQHAGPGVRRVIVIAPPGDDEIIEHLARQLDGRQLQPELRDHLRKAVFLLRGRQDGVVASYVRSARSWASFTPVILPGHDDRKDDKTRKLIHKALEQSGIDQACEFDWSAVSNFPTALSAHRYAHDEQASGGRRAVGYIRPDHLANLTAVHLRLMFKTEVPGPLTIGAGRHCGFGLMAAVD